MNLSCPLPESGVALPIYATFTGVRGVPLLAIGTNSFSPLLRLYDDHLEFKVLRAHSKSYTQIESVSILQFALTNNIQFTWKDSRWTLSANIIRADWLKQAIEFFARKEVPLSDKARALLQEDR